MFSQWCVINMLDIFISFQKSISALCFYLVGLSGFCFWKMYLFICFRVPLIFWLWLFIECIIYKYFLLSHGLPYQVIACFLCRAEPFLASYHLLLLPEFWVQQTHVIIARIKSRSFPMCFLLRNMWYHILYLGL